MRRTPKTTLLALSFAGAAFALLIVAVVALRSAPPPAPPAAVPPAVAAAAPAAPVVAVPGQPAPPPPAAAAAVERLGPPQDADSQQLRTLAKELAAPGSPIENPEALAGFFGALDTAKTSSSPTVIAALGNSLIAGDGVVDIIRARLTAQYGDAGRGLLLADRMASYGARSRTAARAFGWKSSTIAPPFRYRWPFGVTGVHHTADRDGAVSTFTLAGERSAEIFWLDGPDFAGLDVRIDGHPVKELATSGDLSGRRDTVELPSGAHDLTLVAKAKGAVVEGVVLQHERPGVILDMLGVPSSDASLFLETDAAIFSDQLAARRPALVMLMFGGNETKRIAWGRSTADKVDRDLRELIKRVRAATAASCWVVGPLDAVVKRGGDPYAQRDDLDEVIAIERKAALDEGCAFFDLYTAMGGRGSVKRFDARGLMHDDRVHPKGRGLDLLGQQLVDALFDAYAKAPPSRLVATQGQR